MRRHGAAHGVGERECFFLLTRPRQAVFFFGQYKTKRKCMEFNMVNDKNHYIYGYHWRLLKTFLWCDRRHPTFNLENDDKGTWLMFYFSDAWNVVCESLGWVPDVLSLYIWYIRRMYFVPGRFLSHTVEVLCIMST